MVGLAPTASVGADRSAKDSAPWLLGGLGALTLALIAGFFWFRRRLPG